MPPRSIIWEMLFSWSEKLYRTAAHCALRAPPSTSFEESSASNTPCASNRWWKSLVKDKFCITPRQAACTGVLCFFMRSTSNGTVRLSSSKLRQKNKERVDKGGKWAYVIAPSACMIAHESRCRISRAPCINDGAHVQATTQRQR